VKRKIFLSKIKLPRRFIEKNGWMKKNNNYNVSETISDSNQRDVEEDHSTST
jgi:hypothetical protein